MTAGGWGGGRVGSTPWGGGGEADSLTLDSAIAVRENVVRLGFNIPPLLTGILDPQDGSSRHRYSIVAVDGTIGMDGQSSRPVKVVGASRALVVEAGGTFVDVSMDRGFSPFPAQYRITVNNLYATDGTVLDTATASRIFYGLQRERIPATTDVAMMTRDLATPSVVTEDDRIVLGAFTVNETGDLAFDEGLATLKKRIRRRIFTKRGAFTFLPTYGVGLAASIKKLNSAATRNRIAVDTEEQVRREPEILNARVTFSSTSSGAMRMLLVARTRKGSGLRLEEVIGG